METAIAVVGIAVGLLFCLAGIAVYRLWAACHGVLLGVGIGAFVGIYWQSPVTIVLVGALCGGALAFLFYHFRQAGAAVSAAVTGLLTGLLLLHCFDGAQWPYAFILAAVSGGLMLFRFRSMLLVNMAFSGAALAVLSVFGLLTDTYWFDFRFSQPFVNRDTALFLLFSILLIAIAGLSAQLALLQSRRLADSLIVSARSGSRPAEKPIFSRRRRR